MSTLTSRRPSRTLLAIALTLSFFLGAALPAMALRAGSRAPEIGLRDTAGQMVRLSELRGKVVLVDFWASWCGPCREEVPFLNRLQEQFGDDLVIVGVNIDRDESNMRSFMRRTPMQFRVVHDSGGERIAERYGPPRMPSSYIIDQRGVVRYVHAGFRASDASEIEAHVRELVGR